ncbi:MAG: hypothetical protein AAF479_01775 [Pseudomonadota bacterium]
MARPSNFFTHLDGVRVQYDRAPVGTYGETGINYRFYCDEAFQSQLILFISDLKAATEPLFGPMLKVFSAGTYVDRSGMHGQGRAFDLDAIIWQDMRIIADEHPTKKALYLLTQSMAHRQFGTVLGFNFNDAHRDPLHLENGRTPQFRENRSTTYFLQEALNLFYSANLTVDGDYGLRTEAALVEVFDELALQFPPSAADWQRFLAAIAQEAVIFLQEQIEPGASEAGTIGEGEEDRDGVPPAEAEPDENETNTGAGTPAVQSRAALGRIDTTYAPETGWKIEHRMSDSNKWYLKRTGADELYLGYDFVFPGKAYRGLARTGRVADSERFDHEAYEAEHGLWSAFLVPTAMCESEANFMVVNGWDNAAMTLGFLQMAAHTGEHLADLFRELISALPDEADQYFPELKLGAQLDLDDSQANRLFAARGGDRLDLDVAERHPDRLGFRSYDRGRFMAFFNPHRGRVDLEEVAVAARWVAWMQGSPNARAVIVRNAVELSKRAVRRVHELVVNANLAQLPNGLHGVEMAIVQAAMDVKHHGRSNRDQGMSTNQTILHALSKSEPLRSFRYVDTGWREDRSKRNVKEIRNMNSVFEGKTYDAVNEVFR